jgi:hypothetical protein
MPQLFQRAFFFFFFFSAYTTRVAKAQTTLQACPLDVQRLDFTGINETCSRPNDENLCSQCPLTIIQRIVDGGYSVEEINALPIERCLLENLPYMLESGATLLALMALSSCDFDSGNLAANILNNVTFPPPYPGLPTEWLRTNETSSASPPTSSSSTAEEEEEEEEVAKTSGPPAGEEEQEKKSVPVEASSSSSSSSASARARSSTTRVLASCASVVLLASALL